MEKAHPTRWAFFMVPEVPVAIRVKSHVENPYNSRK